MRTAVRCFGCGGGPWTVPSYSPGSVSAYKYLYLYGSPCLFIWYSVFYLFGISYLFTTLHDIPCLFTWYSVPIYMIFRVYLHGDPCHCKCQRLPAAPGVCVCVRARVRVEWCANIDEILQTRVLCRRGTDRGRGATQTRGRGAESGSVWVKVRLEGAGQLFVVTRGRRATSHRADLKAGSNGWFE